MKPHLFLTCVALAVLYPATLSLSAPPPLVTGSGNYFGLVDGATFDVSGCVAISVTSRGTTTVALRIGAEKTALAGTIDAGTQQFTPKSGAANPHQVTFTLTNGVGELPRADGSLSVNGGTVNFSAPLLPPRPTGPNVPSVGKYAAVFDGTIGAVALDTTAGVARMRVLPRGRVKVDPRMADGSVLPFITRVIEDGTARFWRPIGQDGALTGTLSFTNAPGAAADVAGTVKWFKPARPTATYYPEAFNADLALTGSTFQNRSPLLDFSASSGVGLLTVNLSEMAAPLVVEGTLDQRNKFTPSAGEDVKLNFNRGVGSLVGSAKDAAGAGGKLRGVVLQKQNVARGFVLGTAATGEFQLEVKPATP